MGGVCQDPEGQWLVLCQPFLWDMQAILVSDTNPKGDVTINDLELTALIAQVHLFDPKMPLLDHIHTVVNNRKVQGWDNRGSVESATEVGPIQQDLACMAITH